MRKYAYLKEPLMRDGERPVCKVMMHDTGDGVYLYEYDSPDAVFCCADLFYASEEDVHEEWDGLIEDRTWIGIGDPLPGCQQDAFLPIRVKGREEGKPEWGRFEILKDGEWAEFVP